MPTHAILGYIRAGWPKTRTIVRSIYAEFIVRLVSPRTRPRVFPVKQQSPARVKVTSLVPMSCKKRFRPSPTVDSAEADLDDAALRKELHVCKKKQAKAKTAFSNVLSYGLGA